MLFAITMVCPPSRYAIHVVGTKLDNALEDCIMCAVLMEINLGRCTCGLYLCSYLPWSMTQS